MSILDRLVLKHAQLDAARRLDIDLALTAGAGSGKTRALVGRYLSFLEQGAPLRSLIAITFTDKAAREMRSRTRREIEAWLADDASQPHSSPARAAWQQASIELDSARIGTIHALCADLLRLHPAEARVDPRFSVIQEGRDAMLKAEAVASALAWAVTDEEAVRLFAVLKEAQLRGVLDMILNTRLDALPALAQTGALARWERALLGWLASVTGAPAWLAGLAALSHYRATSDDDTLEVSRRESLARWQEAQTALQAADLAAAFGALAMLRSSLSGNRGVLKNWDRDDLASLREARVTMRGHYDDTIAKLLGKEGCDWELDRLAASLLPALARTADRALGEYQALKDQLGGLDFDDLEHLAARLLADGAQAGEVLPDASAILVDEFQDTNDRQRQIVYALAGLGPQAARKANLFVVGDAKQSIYRFRGADVTVFRAIQSDIAGWGGQVLDLDLTFRAHQPLLSAIECLLTELMGEHDDPARPYQVPFAPLVAHRSAPRDGARPPFVEVLIGLGDNADSGRLTAAAALAARLHELHAQQAFDWGHMALLFRSSTHYPAYEDALQAAGIPFVTVSGKGFYARPEVRDVLNALAALSDPSDDLALAGLLRSPAFGLSDAELFRLRLGEDNQPRALYGALLASTEPAHQQAASAIVRLHSLTGRLPVAQLIKAFLDHTGYRGILRTAQHGQRLSRNIDKLLADAHRSQLVSASDFLAYVEGLQDAGAREGEAPAEAGGAVQLMTIHKAKGLEFPLVVLADASHDNTSTSRGAAALDPDLGLLLKVAPDEGKAQSFSWRLGALAEQDRDAAESMRLLYVALTRAQDKVIISGHAKSSSAKASPGKLQVRGWLKQIWQVCGLADYAWPGDDGVPDSPNLDAHWSQALSVVVCPPGALLPPAPRSAAPAEAAAERGPLVLPLPGARLVTLQPEPTETTTPEATSNRVWRVVTAGRSVPAWVIGHLVHEALHRWTFTDLAPRLRPIALRAGLTDAADVAAALREAGRLLDRLRAHALFAEIDTALERHHEVPYAAGQDSGFIDVLFRTASGWNVADFKTDELRDDRALAGKLSAYRAQLARYAAAVQAQLALPSAPRAILVFLNAGRAVRIETL